MQSDGRRWYRYLRIQCIIPRRKLKVEISDIQVGYDYRSSIYKSTTLLMTVSVNVLVKRPEQASPSQLTIMNELER